MLISFHVLFSRPDFLVRNLCTLLFSFSSSLSAPYQSSSCGSFSPLLYITPFFLYITWLLLYITSLFWKPVEIVAHFTIPTMRFMRSFSPSPLQRRNALCAFRSDQRSSNGCLRKRGIHFPRRHYKKKTAETLFAFSAVFLYSVQMQLENTSYCKDVSVICGRDLDTA